MDSSPRRSDTAPAKGQIPLRYLVADRSEAWSQTCSELKFGLSSSLLAANYHELACLRQVCDQLRTCLRQDRVVESGFNEGDTVLPCHPHPQANNFNHVYAVPQVSGSFRTRKIPLSSLSQLSVADNKSMSYLTSLLSFLGCQHQQTPEYHTHLSIACKQLNDPARDVASV